MNDLYEKRGEDSQEKTIDTVRTVEDIVKELNSRDDIELYDTKDLMTDLDYKIRFVAEYMQTKIRYNALHLMIVKLDAGTLEFTPSCPREILVEQKGCMGRYLNLLEIRAEIEKIPLPTI